MIDWDAVSGRLVPYWIAVACSLWILAFLYASKSDPGFNAYCYGMFVPVRSMRSRIRLLDRPFSPFSRPLGQMVGGLDDAVVDWSSILIGLAAPPVLASCVCSLLLTNHSLQAWRLSWFNKIAVRLRWHPAATDYPTDESATRRLRAGFSFFVSSLRSPLGAWHPKLNTDMIWQPKSPTSSVAVSPISMPWQSGLPFFPLRLECWRTFLQASNTLTRWRLGRHERRQAPHPGHRQPLCPGLDRVPRLLPHPRHKAQRACGCHGLESGPRSSNPCLVRMHGLRLHAQTRWPVGRSAVPVHRLSRLPADRSGPHVLDLDVDRGDGQGKPTGLLPRLRRLDRHRCSGELHNPLGIESPLGPPKELPDLLHLARDLRNPDAAGHHSSRALVHHLLDSEHHVLPCVHRTDPGPSARQPLPGAASRSGG